MSSDAPWDVIEACRGAVNAPDGLLIHESSSLYDAISRINRCETAFTVFCIDSDCRVTGVLGRGDVLRFLEKTPGPIDLGQFTARDVMTPRSGVDREGMVWIRDLGRHSWYEQVTNARELNKHRWRRIRLLPVLDDKGRLVNILDLDSPQTRSRIETIVMAASIPVGERLSQTDCALAERRAEFDSIHYGSHWDKVRVLCDLILDWRGGTSLFGDDVFNFGRTDELVHGLHRYEEWLKGHLSVGGLTQTQQRELLERVEQARDVLVNKYTEGGKPLTRYFPLNPDKKLFDEPELIIVLGCRGLGKLRDRVEAALHAVENMADTALPPTIVLSGGGDGHDMTEAQRMLGLIREKKTVSIAKDETRPGWWKLGAFGREVDVVLEEDSLDTLGNAVFSWLTLKLQGGRYHLEGGNPERIKRIVLVTDAMHAPRSYDVFRRVFAYRAPVGVYEGPEIAVKTVGSKGAVADDRKAALDHLRSEAQANTEIFRLVNPLTNGYDIIANGHVRSVLGQMIRLHKLYASRWDLVRKYQACWALEDSAASVESQRVGTKTLPPPVM